MLNVWKRTWTSEMELVAVAVVPSIPLAFVEGMDSTQGVVRGKGAQQVPRLPPDFLSGFVVSINPVRLSLPKAAYVAVY